MREAQSTPVVIRRAGPGDAAAVTQVLRGAFAEFAGTLPPALFDAIVISPEQVTARMAEGPLWLATIDGVAVGTLGAVRDADAYYLRGMAVVPTARGQHVGEALIRTAEQYAHAHGASALTLATRSFQLSAIRLYERLGFVRTGVEDAPWQTERYTMRRPLSLPRQRPG